MTDLLPHQRVIAEQLDSLAGAERIVLSVPVGGGRTAAILPRVISASAHGWVVIVTHTRGLLDQWRHRLVDSGAAVLDLDPTVALQLQDTSIDKQRGVLLVTYSRLTRGPGRMVLDRIPIGLLVLDELPPPRGRIDAVSAEIAARAAQTIALTSEQRSDSLPAWLTSAARIEMSPRQMVELSGTPATPTVVYRAMSSLGAALAQAVSSALGWTQEEVLAASRTKVHSALLEHAENSAGMSAATAWSLLAEIEDLSDDPQLETLLQATRELLQHGPVWVVTGPKLADKYYIQAAFEAAGFSSVVFEYDAPQSTMQEIVGAELMVLTARNLDVLGFPGGSVALVYSSVPVGERETQRLATIIALGRARAVSLIATASNPDPLRLLLQKLA